MPPQRNSRVEKYLERLDNIEPQIVGERIVYRDATAQGYTKYKTGVLFGLDGGGRYSPPTEFPVLYFSADQLASALEVAHHALLNAPTFNPKDIVLSVHEQITDLETIRKILEEVPDTDEAQEKQLSFIESLKKQYPFLQTTDDPELIKLYLKSPRPQAHEFFAISPASGVRLNIPIQLTAKLLDLTNPETLRLLDINEADLLVPTALWKAAQEQQSTWTVCQDIARAAHLSTKFDGLLVPCALPDEERSTLMRLPFNVVLFMQEYKRDKTRFGATFKVTDDFIRVVNEAFRDQSPENPAQVL